VIYDSNSQSARIASAGHKLPAIHHVSANDALQRIHPAGIAMGLDKGPVFDRSITENDVKLDTGDSILIGSAGVVQLKLSSGESIGEERFFKLALGALRSDPANAAHKIVGRIDEHVADSEATADVALVTLTVS
jgi:serine phosphatase RsbU (regulator of sigma subunit)